MPTRSLRHAYDIHGEDASGYKGYQLNVSPASLSATGPLTLTLTDYDGKPVSGVVISAYSSNTGVATVTASAITDANGQATITVTSVASGSAVVNFSYAGAAAPTVGVIPVVIP